MKVSAHENKITFSATHFTARGGQRFIGLSSYSIHSCRGQWLHISPNFITCVKKTGTVHDFCFLQSSCCTRDDLGMSECNIQVSTAGGAQELTLNQHSSAISTISAMTLYDRNSKSRIHLVFCSKFSQDLIVSFLLIAFLHNFSGSCELKTTFSYAK